MMDVSQVRAAAVEALHGLEKELSGWEEDHDRPGSFYWLGGFRRPVPDNASAPCRFFQANGFLHVKGFVTLESCNEMKDEMRRLVRERWHPDNDAKIEEFGTDAKRNAERGDYFLESSDRVHFFAEPAALETMPLTERNASAEGAPPPRLRPEYRGEGHNKVLALNKAGHALHLKGQSKVFHSYSHSPEIVELVTDLGWKDPVIPQSMYIFKQARTGGPVTSHQDSTFLFTDPHQSCLGLWLALDDATLENGCLWVRPKSHRETVRRQYKRNPAHFGPESIQACSNDVRGDSTTPKFVMEDLTASDPRRKAVPWDGKLPDNGLRGLLDAGFVPVECRAGDLLAFCGTLDHLSLDNGSDKARHTFQLHLVEGPSENVSWSPSNWLQYPDSRPFLRLLPSDT
jgi:phytanoyl-CoA hydroxylase